ncbi:unnamed protein product [Acanthoscelides obtectus]|uniref:Cytochrome b5-related protein n=1 Tax=Acanthoscelides obtectus TaxID=200917 RepID=A0A9P0PY41_ACAOB|nr:unnamed protein product [Acanthoscelides obtectus]CAK1669016.1 Cytochrome b5-related protein [Acanthoscelides obtectus]
MSSKPVSAPVSTLGIKPPASRFKSSGLTVDVWLEEKQDTDGAEGLWRVHDGIYDFSDFVSEHPGGSEWLTLTKGTDISEAFEAHHISQYPEQLLKKYFVREANTKRNSPFTFKEDGFYRTLKKEVREALKTMPKQPWNTSNFMVDTMAFFLFLFSVLAVRHWNYFIGILAGIFLGLLSVAAHNYFHRRDNLRMYYFQFSLMQIREWRILHALSHHLHTNTIDDLEISLLEPLLQYLPTAKGPKQRYGSLFLVPIICIFHFHIQFSRRMYDAYKRNGYNLKITDLTAAILPISMYILGGQSLLATLWMWNFILHVGSCHFALVALHAAHHHPDIFHDGDTPRSDENYDWGLSQLDALMERKEIIGSHFLVLTNFGDHCLHHLFPTLDHGALEFLYPVLQKNLEKFDVDLRVVSQWDTFLGSFQQLMRVTPNPNPPDLKKYSKKN